MASNLTFESHGRRYEWAGGFGAVIKSYERGVKIGTMRFIEDATLYAYLVYPRRFRPAEVCWTFRKPTAEAIRAFRCRVFGTLDYGAHPKADYAVDPVASDAALPESARKGSS